MFDSIFARLKAYIHSKRVIHNDDIKVTKPVAAQEDRTQIDAEKQASRIWKSQRQETKMRALIPHSINCEDPIKCEKKPCVSPKDFQYEKPKKLTQKQRKQAEEESKKSVETSRRVMLEEWKTDKQSKDEAIPEALEFNEDMKKDINGNNNNKI